MLFFVNLGGSHKSNHTSYPPPPYQDTLMTHQSVANENHYQLLSRFHMVE
jgi:hypothetical protein